MREAVPVQPVAAVDATTSLPRSSSIESIHLPPKPPKDEPQMITTLQDGIPIEHRLQVLGPDGKVKAAIVARPKPRDMSRKWASEAQRKWESGPSDSPF